MNPGVLFGTSPRRYTMTPFASYRDGTSTIVLSGFFDTDSPASFSPWGKGGPVSKLDEFCQGDPSCGERHDDVVEGSRLARRMGHVSRRWKRSTPVRGNAGAASTPSVE